jgi:hypothetical protein
MIRMSFYSLAFYMRQHFSKKTPPKPPKPPVQPLPTPSSDKDKEDYKEEFEPKPEYGKDIYISLLIR